MFKTLVDNIAEIGSRLNPIDVDAEILKTDELLFSPVTTTLADSIARLGAQLSPPNFKILQANNLLFPPVTPSEILPPTRKRKRSCYSTYSIPPPLPPPKTPTEQRKKYASLYEQYAVSPLPLPFPLTPNLEIYTTPTSGRGIQTLIPNIPAGTLLLLETPLIRDLPLLPSRSHASRLKRAVHSLSKEDQTFFVQLSSHHGGRPADTEMSRFRANAMQSEDDARQEAWTLYRYISFLNHSCCPNASVRVVDVEEGTMELRTLRDIPLAGTEITIDYYPDWSDEPWRLFTAPLQRVAERRRLLRQRWGFVCQCAGCIDTSTDRLRENVNELSSRFFTRQAWRDGFLALQLHVSTYLSSLKRLGLVGKIPAFCRFVLKTCEREYPDCRGEKYRAWVAGLAFEMCEASRVFFGEESREYVRAGREWKRNAGKVGTGSEGSFVDSRENMNVDLDCGSLIS